MSGYGVRYIVDTSVSQLFEVEIPLTEDAPVEQGQGAFEIKPSSMSIVWVKLDGWPWVLSKVKIRGLRSDNGSTGLRIWNSFEGEYNMPPWVKEIISETSPRQEI